ncbi:TPA: efflux RND transporter periplasmic adaptor subunit [Stenotrophomonas maltophilia]|nr:efflux RND transporter periplasmic adaptor subunit [Stenotrophomonas maltophilia]HEL5042753.1 efflux RND transporter periplasmic adaptor subunit [Stenotrophomonas maltophilia]
MTSMKNRVVMVAVAVGLLALGLAGGYWWAQRGGAHDMGLAMAPATGAEERKALYWYDPMVPDQHFDKPGKSPFMDMQLVPKYADEVAGGGIRIDPGLQQSVGIRTALVEVGTLATQLRVPATLTWDLRREAVVSTPVNAIVSRVMVKAPFESVRQGQPLATVLAPEWSSAIAEAQAVGQGQSKFARELQGAAQQRLRVLGVPAGGVRNGGVTLASPQTGVVSEVLVREGQAVIPGTPLFRVNSTDTLWLEAAIPQAGGAGIGPGTKVQASVSAVPGETFDGEVETLLPQIDPTSRTQRARIVLRNEGGQLVPGMFAELTLQGSEGAQMPLVPIEALIATGADSRVIVVGADGSFQPVRVLTGRRSDGRVEILAGLKGGERVVTSGQFLIDSEASLSGALQRLEAPSAPSPEPPAATSDAGMEPRKKMPEAMKSPATPSPPRQPSSGERKVLYWYDPSVPDKHFDKPGKSPFMDMQLVPKYADEADKEAQP